MTSSIPDGKLKHYEVLCNKAPLELTLEEAELIPSILNQLEHPKKANLAKRVFSFISTSKNKTTQRVNSLKHRLYQKQKELDQFFFIQELLKGGSHELLIPYNALKKLRDPSEISHFIAEHSQNIPFLERKLHLAKSELAHSFDFEKMDALILDLLNSQSDEEFMSIFLSYKDEFDEAHFLNFSTVLATKILSHPKLVQVLLFGSFDNPIHKNIQANLAGGIIHILCDKGSSRPIDKESADDLLASLSILKKNSVVDLLKEKSLSKRVNDWSKNLSQLHPSHVKSKQELKSFYQRVASFSKTSWIDHLLAFFSKSEKNLLKLKQDSAKNIPQLKILIKTLKEYGKPLKIRRAECELLEKSDYVSSQIQELRKKSNAKENSELDKLIKSIMDGDEIPESDNEAVLEQLLLRGLKYPEFIYYMHIKPSSDLANRFQKMYSDLKSKALHS